MIEAVGRLPGIFPEWLGGPLGTEVLVWGADPPEAVAGDWWSLTPLARGGSLATALGHDAVGTGHDLERAVAAHPGLVPAALPVPVP